MFLYCSFKLNKLRNIKENIIKIYLIIHKRSISWNYHHNSLMKWFSKFFNFLTRQIVYWHLDRSPQIFFKKWTASHSCKCPASRSPIGSQLGSSRESKAAKPSNASAYLQWCQKMLRSLCWMSRVHYPAEIRTFCASAAARHPTTGGNSTQEADNKTQR